MRKSTDKHEYNSDTNKRSIFRVEPRPGAGFGARIHFDHDAGLNAVVRTLERDPEPLVNALSAANGLLVLRGLVDIIDDPQLLLRLSRLFGAEVENYRETRAAPNTVHANVAEILLVSNMPPARRQPPPRPDPPFNTDGSLPTRFPQRRGWHTDQSYRRPPPDVSLFYAVLPAPAGQGQTLYADCTAAWDALPDELKQDIEGISAIHVRPATGRSEQAVRAGEIPQALTADDQPQRQPLVRVHPVTGRKALYLCEAGQLDWVDGPIAGLSPGLLGEGAKLVYTLMTHITAPEFTYTHEWQRGDLVIYDNRCTVHCATWFDADKHQRLMWRTTTRGNPGSEYAGENPSWRR